MEDNLNKESSLNVTNDNLLNFNSFENIDLSSDLNSTISMFARNKRELSDPAYSIILVCYFVLVCIAGNCL